MKYFDELKKAMNLVAQNKNTIIIGQAVTYPGTAMTNTLSDIPKEKLLEFPVSEDMQMGVSIGMAMDGKIPISIFPRWNFLLLAVNQMINHLEKIKQISNNQFLPKLIIRTGVGSQEPLHPQHQHIGDYTEAFKLMCNHIDIIRLEEAKDILSSYEKALNRTDNRPTILIEISDYYNTK